MNAAIVRRVFALGQQSILLDSGAGIRDVLAKSLGSSNHANVVKATLEALGHLRTREQVMKLRGVKFGRPANGEVSAPAPAPAVAVA